MPPSSIAMATINEGTTLTLSLVITLIGGVVWLTKMYMDIRGIRTEISSLKSDADKQDDKLTSREVKDSDRLARLEEQVKNIQETVNDIKSILRNPAK
jgi:hypothetical protein